MFESLEEALEKAEPVTAAELADGEQVEQGGVKCFIKSAKVVNSEESFVGRTFELSADGVPGTLVIVFAVPPKTPLYAHDKDFLAETHKKYSPEGTVVTGAGFYNVDGKLVVKSDFVMPIMDLVMRQSQLIFDCGDKQASIGVCSPDEKFPVDKVINEALHSLCITD